MGSQDVRHPDAWLCTDTNFSFLASSSPGRSSVRLAVCAPNLGTRQTESLATSCLRHSPWSGTLHAGTEPLPTGSLKQGRESACFLNLPSPYLSTCVSTTSACCGEGTPQWLGTCSQHTCLSSCLCVSAKNLFTSAKPFAGSPWQASCSLPFPVVHASRFPLRVASGFSTMTSSMACFEKATVLR